MVKYKDGSKDTRTELSGSQIKALRSAQTAEAKASFGKALNALLVSTLINGTSVMTAELIQGDVVLSVTPKLGC